MEYGKMIAITGLSGLFELLSSKNDGAIVRSLDDKTTKFVSSRIHNFSHLESIEVYTDRENVNLVEVFQAMEKSGQALPDVKNNNALKAYFQEVFPALDQERVYTSDMKKMVKWFQVLKANNVEFKLSEMVSAEEAPQAAEVNSSASEPAENTAAPAEETAVKKKAPAKKKKTDEAAASAEQGKEQVETSNSAAKTSAEAAPKKAARKKKEEP